MVRRFTALASGSGGNASLLETDGFGLLIDFGMGSRALAARLAAVGCSWDDINAVALTHVHADHWRESTLGCFVRRGIRLLCHSEHAEKFREWSESFRALESAGLVTNFSPETEILIEPTRNVRMRPFPVSHDAGATFGFRIECERKDDLFQKSWAMAYAADLGIWCNGVLRQMLDVDLLALEFNHDVELQRNSGRPEDLIARVLGDQGHLSNEQAGDLLAEVIKTSDPGRLEHVVQLHLSRHCNRPTLAHRAANRALNGSIGAVRVYTAMQHAPVEVRLARE